MKVCKRITGHDFKLVKEQSMLDVRKYLFSQRNIKEWSKLSARCVQASSGNVFNNRIDKYLLHF